MVFGVVRFDFTTFHNDTVLEDSVRRDFGVFEDDRAENLCVLTDDSVGANEDIVREFSRGCYFGILLDNFIKLPDGEII